ncbi:MAG: response regulator [Alphaproteobacteria bacterium]|nr:response regulator [Alphaproteobacteria bacterium]
MRILVVDDNDMFARLTRTKLETWGHKATVVSSGIAAKRLVDREPFRLVIMDWKLPGMSGGELCRHIRNLKRRRYTYVIFYVDAADRDATVQALEAGADDYLVKPFSPVELRLRLKNCKRLLNLEDSLREGAGADESTGLVNLESFRQFFRVVMAENRRTETSGTLMFFHLANYRATFEGHGYGPAERLMVEVSRILHTGVRDSDLVARIDDGSLCMMLQNTFWDRCRTVAEKLMRDIRHTTIIVDDVEFRPEVRVEVVNYPQANLNADQVLREAPRLAVTDL